MIPTEPLHGGTTWFSFDTATTPTSQGTWRHDLVQLLLEVAEPCWSVDDVVVVAGELVANAVEHAGGARRLHVVGTPLGVLVEVADGAKGGFEPRLAGERRGDRGRGLLIVGAIADRWGWRRDERGGKCVWASIGDASGAGHLV